MGRRAALRFALVTTRWPALDAPFQPSGGWNVSRIADLSLAQTAYQLADKKRIWLPTMTEGSSYQHADDSAQPIGEIGPYHADINGSTSQGGIRGPFDVSRLTRTKQRLILHFGS